MDKNERVKLMAQMAATIYAGCMADQNRAGGEVLRKFAISESELILRKAVWTVDNPTKVSLR